MDRISGFSPMPQMFGGFAPQQNPIMGVLEALLAVVMLALTGAFQTGQGQGLFSPNQSPNFGGVNPAGGSMGDGVSNFLGQSPQAAAPAAAAANTGGPAPAGGHIGSGTKVLEIGDSHSVGTFGHELDSKLRGTGAQVATYASAGATGSTFAQGKSTKYGYWEKHADGSERTVNYGQSAQTPRLEDLIAKEKPNVIVVNLGANFRGGDPKSQVDEIGQIAKRHNIPVIWVGPPKTRDDTQNGASIQAFDQKMAQAVAPYGSYVASSPFTPQYSGSDGIHYGGAAGTQAAKNWADGVFGAIMGA